MSQYTVNCSCGSFSLLKDEKPIRMLKIFDLAEPAFFSGDDSDGSRNLSYTILADHAGELNAHLWYEGFMNEFIRSKTSPDWSITTTEIDKYILPLAQAQLLAQTASKILGEDKSCQRRK